MKNEAQLIAYVDRFSAGTFRALQEILDGPLRDVGVEYLFVDDGSGDRSGQNHSAASRLKG